MPCACHAFASAIAALWSPAGKGLASWLLFVMINCVFVTFPCDILGKVWCLIVSIPDHCRLSYLVFKPINLMTLNAYTMYEGWPSKSWTFVITRDCLSGILRNLCHMFIFV